MIRFIIYLIVSFASTFSYAYLFYKLTNAKSTFSWLLIFVFFFGVTSLALIRYFEIPVLSFSVFFLFYPILFYCINKLPFKKLIYYVLVTWFLGMILDLCIMLIVSLLHELIGFDILNKWNATTVTLSLFVALCLFLISHIEKLCYLIKRLYERLMKIRYSNFLILFLTLYVFVSAFVILTSLPNLTIDLLLTLLIFLVIVVFVFLIKYKINEEEIEKYLKILQENNEFYITINDENRIFKHNLIAKLLSIKSVSNKKGMVLIDQLIKDFNKSIDFSENIKIIPYGLNGIIYQKLYPVMNEISIHIVNEIDYDIFEVLKPLRYNVLIEKLSIILDNAIESTLKSHEKIISITIYEEDNNIVILVKNTFDDLIDLDGIGLKNYSTKGKRRGLGLFSALRNNEAILTINVINDFFVSKIVAQKNKDCN